jgi:integrase
MNTVEPIRNRDLLEKIKADLKQSSIRNYGFFLVGINTALRISDILKLRVRDIRGKKQLYIRMTKTGKEITLPISDYLQQELAPLLVGRRPDEYIFLSRQVKITSRIKQSIDRTQAYRIVKETCRKYGLTRIGTHTLRKTFAYHHYKKNNNVGVLIDLLGHQDEHSVMVYIGIVQDDINATMKGFNL